MHPQSPPLNIGGIVLKESVEVDILRVTFDFRMTVGKHLTSISRAASQCICILRLVIPSHASLWNDLGDPTYIRWSETGEFYDLGQCCFSDLYAVRSCFILYTQGEFPAFCVCT